MALRAIGKFSKVKCTILWEPLGRVRLSKTDIYDYASLLRLIMCCEFSEFQMCHIGVCTRTLQWSQVAASVWDLREKKKNKIKVHSEKLVCQSKKKCFIVWKVERNRVAAQTCHEIGAKNVRRKTPEWHFKEMFKFRFFCSSPTDTHSNI